MLGTPRVVYLKAKSMCKTNHVSNLVCSNIQFDFKTYRITSWYYSIKNDLII